LRIDATMPTHDVARLEAIKAQFAETSAPIAALEEQADTQAVLQRFCGMW
jgi:hypothetical protein